MCTKLNNTSAMCSSKININSHLNDEEENSFDSFLKNKWEEAQNKGIFRYILNIKDSKILDGKYKFLAQLNIDRGHKRRTPEHITSVTQPFDENKFNFTKLIPDEIIMNLNSDSTEDIIAVNVSPLEYCHCLLIPQRSKKLPQVITKYSLYKAVEMFSLSSSSYLRVGFNSLCASASVNHLHWHIYYLNKRMLLECIDLEKFIGPIEILKNFPSKGFCIKYSNVKNIDDLVTWTYLVIEYLQKLKVPHHIYITRAKTNSQESYQDLRIYIWARKGNMNVKDTKAFVVGVCEVFGHLSVKCEELYHNLTEDYVARILTNLTEETFVSVVDGLRKSIETHMRNLSLC